jgi:hypothetical protein
MEKVDCPLCKSNISYWSVQHDKKLNIPMQGTIHPDQDVISCLDCGRMMHTDCVWAFKTTILGRHVAFTNGEMRAFVLGNNLAGYPIAFCRTCHDRWADRIPGNYVDAGRAGEAALYLEELGRFKEAGEVRKGGP